MARALRIEFAGAVYHVTARGNERQPIYRSDADRHRFLAILTDLVEQFRLLIHAYVLMDNHYHLLVETLEPNLSRVMRELNGAYAQSFNRAHHRVGHLFQGRYKALLVQRDGYLLELSRYIHLNPVRAGMTTRAENYPWSSARAYVGRYAVPPVLSVAEVLGHFDPKPRRAGRLYARFLREATIRPSPSPFDQAVAQTLLGDPEWVQAMRARIGECISAGRIAIVEAEQPAVRILRRRPTPAEVIAATAAATHTSPQTIGRPRSGGRTRDAAMYLVHKVAGLRLEAVGALFGIQHFGASKAVRRIERDLVRDRQLQGLIAQLKAALQSPHAT